MREYYFIGTVLPTLTLGSPPEMTFEELDQLLSDQLHPSDYKLTWTLRSYYDLENLHALWSEKELGKYGSTRPHLEKVLLDEELQPQYLGEFLDGYKSSAERLRSFPMLLRDYFYEEFRRAKGFVSHYLDFERKWRLVQLAFRAKQLNRCLKDELQFEDLEDEFILQLASQNDSKCFKAPEGFEKLQIVLEAHYKAPIELFKALCDYRFEKIGELAGMAFFSIDRILAYMMQLIIVEQKELI